VDGALARRMKQKTSLGAALDPAADKLLMLVTFTILALHHLVPVWLTVLVIFRDVWIVLGILVLKLAHKGFYIRPTRLSKLNTFCQLFTIFLGFSLAYVRGEQPSFLETSQKYMEGVLLGAIYLTGAMTVLSGIQYTRIGGKIFKGSEDYATFSFEKSKDRRQ